MLEQQKVIKRKRINLHVPNSSKLRVLTPEEIGQLSSMLSENQQQMPTLKRHEKKLFGPEVGPFPLQYHQGISEICMQNNKHQQQLPDSTTQIDVMPQDLKNTLQRESMFAAAHELANLHKTSKYQAFKKRILASQAKTDENNVGSTHIIQIKPDSEDESESGKSAEFNQGLQSYQDERRKKNKEAAKRCRMKKKMLQNEIAMRAAFLAQENYELRRELDMLKYQMALLRREL